MLCSLLTGCIKSEQKTPESTETPTESIYDYNNAPVSLNDLTKDGKTAVLNFWTTWCPYCLEEMPDFNEVYGQYMDSVNFYMIDVNGGSNDNMDEAKAYVEGKGYDFPVYFDTDLSAVTKYSVNAFPTTVIIDPDGNTIYNNSGMISKETLISLIEESSR